MKLHTPKSTLFPTRRSSDLRAQQVHEGELVGAQAGLVVVDRPPTVRDHAVRVGVEPGEDRGPAGRAQRVGRSEEHTSELQSLAYLVCRLLLEKKKKQEIQEY